MQKKKKIKYYKIIIKIKIVCRPSAKNLKILNIIIYVLQHKMYYQTC